MKIRLISYADKQYFKAQKKLNESALRNGFDSVHSYNDVWLRNERFYLSNRRILDSRRGSGYWLWKPYIILHALAQLGEDDVLFYLDSGTALVSSVRPIAEIVKRKGIVLFNNAEHKTSTWTKRDCFYFMGCDDPKYHQGHQVLAGYIGLRKSEIAHFLVSEWLRYATDERIISDDANVCGLPNLPDFVDHRHDQSILSILAIKHQLEVFRDPSQWGNPYKAPDFRILNEFCHRDYVSHPFANSPYPTILEAHRKKIPLTLLDNLEYAWIEMKAGIGIS